jgi:DNA-nicking Smr family endonuclease
VKRRADAGPLKSLAELARLRRQLAAEREAAREAERRAQQERRRKEEEATLFARSVGPVQTLPPVDRALHRRPPAAPEPRQRLRDEQAVLAESLSDAFDPGTLLDVDDELSYRRAGIGADVLRKLRRGDWALQAQIDLHGLRSDEAREALGEFLRLSVRRGLRCVRVVHGKGLNSEGKEPVLKAKVRRWLAQKQEVIAFCQARPAEGGAGALLVLLRAAEPGGR